MNWNLNTVLIGASLIVLVGGWGWAWGDVQSGLEDHEKRVTSLETRVGAIEVDNRRLDTVELRLSTVETRSVDTNASIRSLETTLNDLASDIKVTREILQRIETRSNGRTLPAD